MPVRNFAPADESAWAVYTPTVTPGSGSLGSVTAAGRYKQLGKTTFVRIRVSVTTNGTAAGNLTVTLPFPAPNNERQFLAGCESGVTGKVLRGTVIPNTANMVVTFYDNGYPGGDSHELNLEGVYESQ